MNFILLGISFMLNQFIRFLYISPCYFLICLYLYEMQVKQNT